MSSPVPHGELQKLAQEGVIELFTLDASSVSGGVHRFCGEREADGGAITFNGIEYPFVPIKGEGFEWNGDGTLPRPKITVSALNAAFYSMVVAMMAEDEGMILLRRDRTLTKYLDGHAEEGHDYRFPADLYVIDRILSMDKAAIQFELICPTDLPRAKLPSRQALRNSCPWIYRHYNSTTGQFVYDTTENTCPYAGIACFKKDGTMTTNPAEDVCGRRLSDCVLRFGRTALPYGAFPGIARARAAR